MPYKNTETKSLPIDVKRQICALCAGYHRRCVELERGARREKGAHRAAVLKLYKQQNDAIDRAVDSICKTDSPEVKREYIRALAEKRGHAWSPLCTLISPNAFYQTKSKLLAAIAKELNLI